MLGIGRWRGGGRCERCEGARGFLGHARDRRRRARRHGFWHWLYEHPKASAAEFREAVVSIAEKAWNRWYAPLLGGKNVPILAIYSHMVDAALYTPDYPLGHLIEFQVEDYFRWKGGAMGPGVRADRKVGIDHPRRVDAPGRGAALSAAPLLKAAEKALAALGG